MHWALIDLQKAFRAVLTGVAEDSAHGERGWLELTVRFNRESTDAQLER